MVATGVNLIMIEKSRAASCTPYVLTSPLWSRAPARDENGKPHSDFMMLIPGLKQQTEAGIESCLLKIRDCLLPFENSVVYVDLNIKLGLLWVSHKAIPGITKPLVLAIQREIPQAKLIMADFGADLTDDSKPASHWLTSLGHSVKQSLKLIRLG